MQSDEQLRQLLERIYGPQTAESALARILPKIAGFPSRPRRKTDLFSQGDVALITYGDTLLQDGRAPLAVMGDFVRTHLRSAVSMVHFLPFFPWSSDDGFSVKDFYTINPELGSWEDVTALSSDFELMFDFVLNHFSSRSQWFDNYLADRSGFRDMAIEVDPAVDLSMVTRPRPWPVLSRYPKKDGRDVHLWTTFSADQIDFNYRSLDVLEKIIDVLLFYVQKGAHALRLDAVAYLWKEIGTACIHLDQTHAMVQLFRAILDRVAPDALLVTETNVPHAENISYFGDGQNEAQMVYNFALPPLLLHAFTTRDSRLLGRWAATLKLDSPQATFFNFTASHDGIGVRPLEGILPPAEIESLVRLVRDCGGQVSVKRNPDGSNSPYELNITYLDAIIGRAGKFQAERFLASQAVQYTLPGVPATYIHSLLGSRNWTAGVKATGRARSINRERLPMTGIAADLQDPVSWRSRIFHPLVSMMALRRRQPAFHPKAPFDIVTLDPRVFAIRRHTEVQTLLAITNISQEPVSISWDTLGLGFPVVDVISGGRLTGSPLVLKPYQYLWLEPRPRATI